jgi:hypothetical protein
MQKYTGIEAQVEFATSKIDSERRVEISLRDLMFVFSTVGELIRFFHQPLHYESLEDVKIFIGDKDKGALHLLFTVYYDKLRDVWPEDIQKGFDEGLFYNPHPPYYYESKSDLQDGETSV